MDKKYYWLKLKKDFFKRHDIKIIEDMDNGKDYILFYLKLLCESVDHEGNLRFSETIPYNEKMLSTITNTNIDIVRSAMKVFTELNMVEVLEDKTIFMRECERMLGCETYWAERKREQRRIGQCPTNVQLMSNMSKQEIEKDIELDIDKEKDKASDEQVITSLSKKFTPPTVEEVKAYCEERNNGIDAEWFVAFYSSKGWKVGNQPMKSWKSAIVTWEKRNRQDNSPNSFTARKYTENDVNKLFDDIDEVNL
jgi:predicted phage replisome organizer